MWRLVEKWVNIYADSGGDIVLRLIKNPIKLIASIFSDQTKSQQSLPIISPYKLSSLMHIQCIHATTHCNKSKKIRFAHPQNAQFPFARSHAALNRNKYDCMSTCHHSNLSPSIDKNYRCAQTMQSRVLRTVGITQLRSDSTSIWQSFSVYPVDSPDGANCLLIHFRHTSPNCHLHPNLVRYSHIFMIICTWFVR